MPKLLEAAPSPEKPSSPASAAPPVSNGVWLLQVIILVVATFWIFSPALDGAWLWDDGIDIPQNPVIQDPTGLWKIWFQPGALIDYYPIKASVQWMQWNLWHEHTFGYHLTNLLLHLLSAFLVWRLLSKFGLPLAWFGGLLFAIHPVQVESVAWIAELKNTLSLPPLLLAMCFYIDYENEKKQNAYFLALGCFLIAMLTKTTMVMFPVVILLYVWWKKRRIGWSDVKTSAPFFAISLVLGLVTLFVGSWYRHLHPSTPDIEHLGSLASRLASAGLIASSYFARVFWPFDLMPIYPKWPVDPPSPLQFLPWPILGGAFYWLWTKRESWGRHALLGLGFFFINLIPFVGLISTSYMAFTWTMDHFLYIPIIGLIGLVVAGLGEIRRRLSPSLRFSGSGIVAAITLLLAVESHDYAGKFINQETLWSYTLQRNPGAYPGYINLGNALRERGLLSEAIEQYQKALIVKPNYAEAHNNYGSALALLGHSSEAIDQFRQAIKIEPTYVEAHDNLGNVFYQNYRDAEAIEQFKETLRLYPGFSNAKKRLEELEGPQKTSEKNSPGP